MKVLVTGSSGFIGKNLIERLSHIDGIDTITFDKEDKIDSLASKVAEADFIFHLAGVNRPENKEEFYEGNRNLTQYLLELVKKVNKKTPVLMTSSTQVENDSDYGKSKLQGEKVLENYAKETDGVVYIYRLPNVFGKWSRPAF